MAKSKLSPKTLTRLFDRTTVPVYVVSPDQLIAYANPACAQWVGLDLESLVSCPCVFTSQDLDDLAQNKVRGLCPPPAASLPTTFDSGSESTSFVVSAVNQRNQKTWRSATMTPLIDADQNQLGILVVCGDSDLPNPPSTELVAAGVDSKQLHMALAEIRGSRDSTHSLESLVGTSPFSNRLRRQVDTAIETNSDLLIFGPRGSGKEHLARTIHAARSQRHSSELLPVHCSIADQPLIQQNIKDIVASRTDSGSDSNRLEQDWLLLIDVDRLGDAAQVELLGFFQLPNFPLRTIATSSDSLIALANQGSFCVDLAHHLSTMTIELVALAQRQTDVPFLAQALIERDNARRDRQLSGFSTEVMQQFIEYNWPENIDQLNRTIQLAARNASGVEIQPTDLPDEFQHALKAMRIGTATETEIQLDQFLNQIEKELVARALKQAKGNKTKASKLLGISRPKLLRRIHFLGLDDRDADSVSATGGSNELDASDFEELK